MGFFLDTTLADFILVLDRRQPYDVDHYNCPALQLATRRKRDSAPLALILNYCVVLRAAVCAYSPHRNIIIFYTTMLYLRRRQIYQCDTVNRECLTHNTVYKTFTTRYNILFYAFHVCTCVRILYTA